MSDWWKKKPYIPQINIDVLFSLLHLIILCKRRNGFTYVKNVLLFQLVSAMIYNNYSNSIYFPILSNCPLWLMSRVKWTMSTLIATNL